jgi:hypothetical protein
MPVAAAAVLFDECLHDLLDGIEAVHDEMIAQRAPTDVFPTLHAHVNQYERFREQSRTHHPLGEFGLAVEPEIHFAGLFPRRRSARGWPPTRTKQLQSNCPNASLRLKTNGSWSSDIGQMGDKAPPAVIGQDENAGTLRRSP